MCWIFFGHACGRFGRVESRFGRGTLTLDARRLALGAEPMTLDARRLALGAEPLTLDARRLALGAEIMTLDAIQKNSLQNIAHPADLPIFQPYFDAMRMKARVCQ